MTNLRDSGPAARILAVAATLGLLAGSAAATITPNPASVSLYPTQRSSLITLNITFPAAPSPGTATVAFQSPPAGLTTVPVPPDTTSGPVTFDYTTGATSATVQLRFDAAGSTLSGTYPLTISVTPLNAGSVILPVQVLAPSITPTASPNPATIARGGSRSVVVVSTATPGFTSNVSYYFGGFPAGFTTGPTQVVGPPYNPATFTFAVSAATAAGTYNGALFAQVGFVTPAAYPMTVIVQQPDIAVSFSQPTLALCSGGPAAGNAINLLSVNGYTGTPTLTFTAVPAGLTVNPTNPLAAPMPPAQSVPFTVAAPGASPGPHLVTLRVQDASVGIDKNATFTATVTAPDFAPAAAPVPLALTAGGGAQALTASITPNACFTTTPVTVTPLSAPAGVTFSPASQTLVPPGFAAASFAVQAGPGVAPGTYPMTLAFAAGAGTPKTVPVALVVALAPDFSLAASPPAVSVATGQSASLTITATGINGFAGTVAVVAPTAPGVTFVPASFTLLAGASQAVAVNVAASTPPGTMALAFSGTAAGVSGPRTAPFTLTITPGPDFALAVAPAALTLPPGGAGAVSVTATGLNGFAGTVNVAAPVLAGVTFTPSTFAVTAGTPQTVAVAVAASAPPGSSSGLFTGTAATVAGPRTATLTLTVTPPPDFTLAVSPPALTVAQGASGSVTVASTGLNGLAGPVSVTAPAVAGVTFFPAAFTLPPTGAQAVTVQVSELAATGPFQVSFAATAPGVAATRTATLNLTVGPAPPRLDGMTPQAFAAGTVRNSVRLRGRNFRPGATVISASPAVVVEQTTVTSPTAADVVLSVRADASPGPYRLDLTNPDGATTPQGAIALVYPTTSLGAPLGVTAVAIVYPRPFTIVSAAEPVFPRGLLATTGLGTVIGAWLFDGVPFDRFTASAASGMPVEVTSHVPIPAAFFGGHRLELAIEHPQTLLSEAVPIVAAVDSHSRLALLAPEDGAVLGAEPPLFRWSIVPGASGYEVEIAPAGEGPARRVRLSASEWRPDEGFAAGLGPGVHRFRVRAVFPGEVTSEPTEWRRLVVPAAAEKSAPAKASASALQYRASFRLARLDPGTSAGAFSLAAARMLAAPEEAPQETPPPAEPVGEGQPTAADDGVHTDWSLGLMSTFTGVDEEGASTGDEARLQASTQLDIAGGGGKVKGTGDLAGRRNLDPPEGTATESRNWQLEAAAGPAAFRGELRGGYSPPDFLDQSEFLPAGLARGGALGKAVTQAGTLGYYRTFDQKTAGAGGGTVGARQKLEAVGFQAPWDETRVLLRAFAVRAEDEGGPYSPGGRAEAVGLLGRLAISPAFNLVLEGAQGELASGRARKQPEPSGLALRLGANGNVGAFNYAVALRRTEGDFINPLNPGFTPGGVPDRIGGDLSLGATIGQAMLSLQLRRWESGALDDGDAPTTAESGGAVNLDLPLAAKVRVSASATLATTAGDADPAAWLPESDRTQRGLTVTLTETPGRVSFVQSLSYQEMLDDITPSADQKTSMASLSANGSLTAALNLAATLSGTRNEGSPDAGTTDQLMLSLQPGLSLSGAGLTITPRGSYSRSTNGTFDSDSRSEQYQLMVQWTPSWASSLLSLQLSADWNRSRSGYQTGPAPFQRRYAGTLTLSWRASRSAPPAPPTATLLDPIAPVHTAGLLGAAWPAPTSPFGTPAR